MSVGGLVEGRCNNLGIDAALHIGHLFGAFVDKQNHDVCFGVILGNSIGDIFEQQCLTGLRRCHDKAALAFAYRCEHIDYAGRHCARTTRGKVEFLVGEKGSKMLESNTVADKFEAAAIDTQYVGEGEVFLAFAGSTDSSLYHIALAQAEGLDLGHGHVYIVGRGKIVEVGRAQESKPFGNYFENACSLEYAVEVIPWLLLLLAALHALLLALAFALLPFCCCPCWLGSPRVIGLLLLLLLFCSPTIALVARNEFTTFRTREKLAQCRIVSGGKSRALRFYSLLGSRFYNFGGSIFA